VPIKRAKRSRKKRSNEEERGRRKGENTHVEHETKGTATRRNRLT